MDSSRIIQLSELFAASNLALLSAGSIVRTRIEDIARAYLNLDGFSSGLPAICAADTPPAVGVITPLKVQSELKCPDAPKKSPAPRTPKRKAERDDGCPWAPKKSRTLSTPTRIRRVPQCPDAPKKSR